MSPRDPTLTIDIVLVYVTYLVYSLTMVRYVSVVLLHIKWTFP